MARSRNGSRASTPLIGGIFAVAAVAIFDACPSFVSTVLRSSVSTPLVARGAARGMAEKKKAPNVDFKINDEIRCSEVRLIAELSDDPNEKEMKEMNEVLQTKDALSRASARGLDLIMINEDAEIPIVKIVGAGKYAYDQKKKDKAMTAKGKAPKMKEVKMSYVIGDHDMQTHIRKIEKWFQGPQGSKQQVQIKIVMKGRTRMFENQARELIERVRKDVAPFGKAAGGETGNYVKKDGRGDLLMLLSHGSDIKLLKEIKAEAEQAGLLDDDEEEEEEEEEDEDDEGDADEEEEAGPPADASLLQEMKELEAEFEETKQDLLDCGIKPGQIASQEEMRDLNSRMSALKTKIAAR